MDAWWERLVLRCSRAALLLWALWLVIGAPLIAVGTVIGAVNGAAGAVEAGVRVPVMIDTPAPALARQPVADSPVASVVPSVGGSDTLRVAVDIGVAGLGVDAALLCCLLWLSISAAAAPVLWQLYRLSHDLKRERLTSSIVQQVPRLAARIVLAGAAWSVLSTASSAVAAAAAPMPAHTSVTLAPVLSALGGAGLLLLLAVALRRAEVLQAEQDLTI